MALRTETLQKFTDCAYFLRGTCKKDTECRFRHNLKVLTTNKNCFKWPDTCRNESCPFRHPHEQKSDLIKTEKKSQIIDITPSLPPKDNVVRRGSILFCWDIENIQIPRGQIPFKIVQNIRQRFVSSSQQSEESFVCFCDMNKLSKENQLSLHHANVRLVHIVDNKPGASDREILRELDHFERTHEPPATVVLLSGDIDFVGKLHDLRYKARFEVILIHNNHTKIELRETVNEAYPWQDFLSKNTPIDTADEPKKGETTNRKIEKDKPDTSNKSRKYQAANPNKEKYETCTPKDQHQQKECRCFKCKTSFNSFNERKAHQEAEQHYLKCAKCGHHCYSDDHFDRHFRECKETSYREEPKPRNEKSNNPFDVTAVNSSTNTFACPRCDEKFSSLDLNRKHQEAQLHYLKCAKCDHHCYSKRYFDRHSRECKETSPQEEPKPRNEKSNNPFDVATVNSSTNTFACPRCDEKFSSQGLNRKHQEAEQHYLKCAKCDHHCYSKRYFERHASACTGASKQEEPNSQRKRLNSSKKNISSENMGFKTKGRNRMIRDRPNNRRSGTQKNEPEALDLESFFQ